MQKDRTRAILLFVVVIAFTVLILGGMGIAKHKPPIPGKTVDPDGAVLFTHDDIMTGQKYYLARGGQHVGSIYGHGAYLAPDWTADALHRTALVTAGLAAGFTPDDARRMTQEEFEALEVGERGRIEALVAADLHTNRYDEATDTLTLSAGQAAAFPVLVEYYTTLFTEGNDAMSIRPGMVDTPENGRVMTAFFFWTAWTA
ncbi:MAG: nitric-oxide reductase large subunit, partial [Phycisphaeraceae bacterium]|nr:nitric-oxide reductase large subunit [Phycisphaeraceae bacterium]